MDDNELNKRKLELAGRVVALARQAVLANAFFLAPALQKLHTEYRVLGTPFSTDGQTLFVDPDVVLSEYARTRTPPTHDLLHVLLHCLLLHPFVRNASGMNREAWELASDIEVERLSAELLGARPGPRGEALKVIVGTLERELGGPLGTESIYRALERGEFSRQRLAWRQVVAVDDPAWWPQSHRTSRRSGEASESSEGLREEHKGGGPHTSGASSSIRLPKESDDGSQEGSQGSKTEPPHRSGSGQEPNDPSPRSRSVREAYDERAEAGDLDLPPEGLREEWRRAARSVHLDLETMSRQQGRNLGELSHALEVSGTPQTSLTSFLRQFASYHEVLHVSPDEFDYVFYTYGLKLFGNMPLIENLEVSEQHRVHDFVIVLDTSASVEGEAIKSFVEQTYAILSAEDLYCSQVNIHVVQCDAAVREDTRLTSKADLERWKAKVVLRGFGGTDFRPAFEYVDKLVAQGEFEELAGLLYFTDGWGTYPERPPSYRVAFVFYDSNHPRESVPPWAMQVELSRGELDRGAYEH